MFVDHHVRDMDIITLAVLLALRPHSVCDCELLQHPCLSASRAHCSTRNSEALNHQHHSTTGQPSAIRHVPHRSFDKSTVPAASTADQSHHCVMQWFQAGN